MRNSKMESANGPTDCRVKKRISIYDPMNYHDPDLDVLVKEAFQKCKEK